MPRSAWVAWAVLFAAVAAAPSPAAEPTPAVDLFNGKNLEGWVGHLVDANVKTEDVWQVKDGVLVCRGAPLGYLASKESFQDFELKLEWRWAPGQPAGNSGVLLRIAGKPIGFMPKCVEAQLKHGSAGDIWAFRGFALTGPADRLRKVDKHKELGDFVGTAKLKDAEKQPGEWNVYSIRLVGDKLTLQVNGEAVNEATGCEALAGPIGLQSEGGEIHFRNITLTRVAK